MKKVTIEIEIPEDRIRNLLGCAIEGGSAYWCESCDRRNATRKQAEYRQDVPFVKGAWLEITAAEINKIFKVDREAIENGMAAFAVKCPRQFAEFMNENEDAGDGDAFLQCCVFGEVVYG